MFTTNFFITFILFKSTDINHLRKKIKPGMIWILEQEVAASGFTEISGENFNSVDIDCDSGCGRAVAGDLLLLFLVILIR